MGQISELLEARHRLGLALSPICHDRWVLGYLRGGSLQPLGATLTPLVTAFRRPLGRLNESEGEVAQLLSYGLSTEEIARAIKTDEPHTRALVSSVARKLRSVNTDDLVFPIVPMKRRNFRL